MRPAPLWGKAWPVWERRLQRAPALALFSDFDGTLSPIVRRAPRARLPAPTRLLLRRLARQRGVFVGIVSGRPVAELRRLVRLPQLAYIGIHGIELAWPGQPMISRARREDREQVRTVRVQLEQALGDIPGLWVEDKGASVAVHYRQAAARHVPRIEKEVRRGARRFAGRLKLQAGKKVLELVPAVGASKAVGVLEMLKKLQRRRRRPPLPLYLGDDRTDETVFRRLGNRGLTILVGRPDTRAAERPRRSAARYFLADPGDVRRFLRRLLALRAAR